MRFLIKSYIIVSVLFSCRVFAQEQPKPTTLEEMISLALENNPDYKNSDLYIEKSTYAKRTAWEPGQTIFDWTHGQINSALNDDYFLLAQELGSPFMHASKSKIFKHEKEYYSLLRDKTGKEIRRDISIAYNNWLYFATIENITDLTLGYLQRAAEYSGLQYTTGESSLLSKMLMETKYLDMGSYRKSIANQKFDSQVELNRLVFSENNIMPADTGLLIRDDSLILAHDFKTDQTSPELKLAGQMKNIAQSNLGFQRSVISPTFRAGYFNQKIDHVSGFDGWQLGIGFPLWFFPQRSRIQMAVIDRSIAENRYNYQKAATNYELMTLYKKLQLLNERIEFFQNRMLLNAATIEDNALKMYKSGEIGYIEYIQNIITANKSREDYWTLVRDHNQVIYGIEYYLNE